MMIGQSPPIQELRARIGRVAGTHFTVLVEGESGVGKELVARAIHDASPRRSGPFVAINCAALVDSLLEAELFGIEDRTATGVRGRRGKFELADHGTLFLDEVADLSPSAQAKLLRVLQDFPDRARWRNQHASWSTRAWWRPPTGVSSSWSSPDDFDADLYYRIAGVELHVPPLRATAAGRAAAGRALRRRGGGGPDCCTSRRTPSRRWSRTSGPATCGSWRASWNGRWRSRRVPRCTLRICRPMLRQIYGNTTGARLSRPHAARVEQSLRAARARSVRRQQAPGVRDSRHHLQDAAVAASPSCDRRHACAFGAGGTAGAGPVRTGRIDK